MKNIKSYIMLGLFAVSFLVGIVCSIKGLLGYAIFAFTVAVIFGLFGSHAILGSRNPGQAYESEIKDILNTYDSILLKCSSVPNFEDRNIIRVESMDDLVDAQYEIRKPICYLKQTDSCAFILLDEKEAYVFIEKLNPEELSPVEIEMNNLKFRKKSNIDMDSEMLQDIDKTTIIKLSNKKSYKVSPIRKNKEEKKETIKPKEYEAEYLFDDTVELLDDVVNNVKDDVEVLDF